ncbi:hypothetical protein L208DRAFT_1308359, partial [Tricholoma matsutake]
ELYLQFSKVIILKQQWGIRDLVWNNILQRLRTGDCEAEDLHEIHKLILGTIECDMPDFDKEPWSDAILITSRHGVQSQWNAASVRKHAAKTGHRVYISL